MCSPHSHAVTWFVPPFARFRHRPSSWLCVHIRRYLREPLCERPCLSTPGVLGSGSGYVVPSPHRLLRPHPSVSPARGDFTDQPLIRRARPSLLSLLCFPHVPSTVRRWVRGADPLCSRLVTRLPRPTTESPPTRPVSASHTRRGNDFGAASFASCCGPRVCQALLTGYNDAHRCVAF